MVRFEAGPEVRKLAKKMKIDLGQIEGTGWSPCWKCMVVTMKDLLKYIAARDEEVELRRAA